MPQAIRLHKQPPREKKEVRIKLAERALAHQRCSVYIAVLEQLLATLMPKQTAVLPNYPNPFNPDTRIPYQLAMQAEVEISIYPADGTLVRTLVLGQLQAGVYASKSRAAYWDGRNAHGEPVASGVYF